MAIRIRHFRPGDEDALVLQANNPQIGATLRDAFPHPYTHEDAYHWVSTCCADGVDRSTHRAIVLDDKLIGGIGILRDSDVHRFNAEVGYWLGEAYWGKGYTTEALRQWVEWLFSNTDLSRLYAGVFSFNQPSMRVLAKVGFQQEAVHRAAIFKNRQFWDEHYFVKFRQ